MDCVLVARRMRGALLLGILATTALAIGLNETIGGGSAFSHIAPGVARVPERIVALPAREHFGLVGAFSFGFVGRMGMLSATLAVFALMLGDFFDTIGPLQT
jgi:AGZA family xanthine/uracil permease-like MFS transporter